MIGATELPIGLPVRAIHTAIVARAAGIVNDAVFIRRIKRQIQDQSAGPGVPPVL